MIRRLGLVITIALAMSLTCAGLVLAQSRDAEDGGATRDEELVEGAPGLEAGDPIPGKYIVVLEEEVENPASVADDLSDELNLDASNVYDDAIEGFAAEVPAGELSELRADPRVESVVQDRVIEATVQTTPTGIDRVEADKSSTLAGNGAGDVDADIAIIDSGISEHEDLDVEGGYSCVGQNSAAYSDGNGHGTHVAGTAAARDNDIGVVGVAPGARLWAVKVLNDDGDGSFNSVICGVEWVTDHASTIEVANLSLGAPASGSDNNGCGWKRDRLASTLHQAICESVGAGVFYAVAAGNDRSNFGKEIPAAFNQVLTVTAITDFDGEPGGETGSTCNSDNDDTAANFSNYATAGGRDAQHTIAAPGVCIRSTWKNNAYKSISGTSMASPHVAGTAALCIAAPGACTGSPQDTMNKLRNDAEAQPALYGYRGDPDNPIRDRYYGFLEYAGSY